MSVGLLAACGGDGVGDSGIDRSRTVGVLDDCATRDDPCDISACPPILGCSG